MKKYVLKCNKYKDRRMERIVFKKSVTLNKLTFIALRL